jgi:hypothetical protein
LGAQLFLLTFAQCIAGALSLKIARLAKNMYFLAASVLFDSPLHKRFVDLQTESGANGFTRIGVYDTNLGDTDAEGATIRCF